MNFNHPPSFPAFPPKLSQSKSAGNIESNLSANVPRERSGEVANMLCSIQGIGRSDRVLDLGCGIGESVLRVASSTGAQVVGVDVCEERIRKAIEISRKEDPTQRNVQFIVESAQSLPFAPESFESVYCERSLNYFESSSRVVADLERILKPTGSVAIVDVYKKRSVENSKETFDHWLGKNHRLPKLDGFVSLFEEVGMNLDWFEPCDHLLYDHVESLIWKSLIEGVMLEGEDWEGAFSTRGACDILRAIDEKEIGYGIMVFKKNVA